MLKGREGGMIWERREGGMLKGLEGGIGWTGERQLTRPFMRPRRVNIILTGTCEGGGTLFSSAAGRREGRGKEG